MGDTILIYLILLILFNLLYLIQYFSQFQKVSYDKYLSFDFI